MLDSVCLNIVSFVVQGSRTTSFEDDHSRTSAGKQTRTDSLRQPHAQATSTSAKREYIDDAEVDVLTMYMVGKKHPRKRSLRRSPHFHEVPSLIPASLRFCHRPTSRPNPSLYLRRCWATHGPQCASVPSSLLHSSYRLRHSPISNNCSQL